MTDVLLEFAGRDWIRLPGRDLMWGHGDMRIDIEGDSKRGYQAFLYAPSCIITAEKANSPSEALEELKRAGSIEWRKTVENPQ